MKQLFIVSNCQEVWKGELLDAFVVEPCIHHQMLLNNTIERFQHVSVATNRRVSKKDLEIDNAYVNKKYELFVTILSTRLNYVHKTKHDVTFWKKCLSMGFIRYITLVHDAFMSFEQDFDSSKNDCYALARESYVLPFDFEDQRNLIQYSDLGREQLFSIYLNLFYPDKFSSILATKKDASKKNTIRNFGNLLKRFKKLTVKKILVRFYTKCAKNSKVEVGLFGAYFSQDYLYKLILKTKGVISVINNVSKDNIHKKKKDLAIRRDFSQDEVDFERFDKFFFKSIETLFPSVLLEDFKATSNEIEKHFSAYKNIKYLTSESWIGSTIDSIALAHMRQKNVKHIYNEHNALFYPFVGTMVERRAELTDIYYSMGWQNKKISNLVPGASLFEFSINKSNVEKYPITLISNNLLAKIPEYSAFYGFGAGNVDKYAWYMKAFYRSLNEKVKENILYRGPRPGNEDLYTFSYDNEFLLKPFLSQLNNKDVKHLSGKELIASSGLVIVDYMATPFLESMHMNVPTIFLLNKDIYYLKDEYLDFFDELVEVGICQTNPDVAADFINEMGDGIKQWWKNGRVQRARQSFLDTNFGDTEDAINFYLSLVKD